MGKKLTKVSSLHFQALSCDRNKISVVHISRFCRARVDIDSKLRSIYYIKTLLVSAPEEKPTPALSNSSRSIWHGLVDKCCPPVVNWRNNRGLHANCTQRGLKLDSNSTFLLRTSSNHCATVLPFTNKHNKVC